MIPRKTAAERTSRYRITNQVMKVVPQSGDPALPPAVTRTSAGSEPGFTPVHNFAILCAMSSKPGPARILIVDDDHGNGALVARLLEAAGYAAEHLPQPL